MTILVLALSVHIAAGENCTFYDQESLQKNKIWQVFAIIIQCSLCILLGCVLKWQKCQFQELEHSQKEKNYGTDTWVAAYGWLFAVEKLYPF